MIYCGTWCAAIFDKDGFTDYAMFRMPGIKGGKGDPNANFLVPEGYMVSSKTKHPKEAVEWASFVVSDDMAAKFAEKLKMIPSNAEEGRHRSRARPSSSSGSSRTSSSFSKGINVLDVLLENSVSEAYLNDGVEILNGTTTPEQAMAKIRAVGGRGKEEARQVAAEIARRRARCPPAVRQERASRSRRSGSSPSPSSPLGTGRTSSTRARRDDLGRTAT